MANGEDYYEQKMWEFMNRNNPNFPWVPVERKDFPFPTWDNLTEAVQFIILYEITQDYDFGRACALLRLEGRDIDAIHTMNARVIARNEMEKRIEERLQRQQLADADADPSTAKTLEEFLADDAEYHLLPKHLTFQIHHAEICTGVSFLKERFQLRRFASRLPGYEGTHVEEPFRAAPSEVTADSITGEVEDVERGVRGDMGPPRRPGARRIKRTRK